VNTLIPMALLLALIAPALGDYWIVRRRKRAS
jgi:hypothetical protein